MFSLCVIYAVRTPKCGESSSVAAVESTFDISKIPSKATAAGEISRKSCFRHVTWSEISEISRGTAGTRHVLTAKPIEIGKTNSSNLAMDWSNFIVL
ncbi:predicted protein [Sclerotinia sclerotiorum 1980 UF-70]|uniref:Uncharacterized protein n=1 Tax=Sclerotinia sclerotiorum (strain ATCC 18683 / 1980 / Ss-1) TaxID=665079 RepID=A7F1T1_SCLS1|nr:predicted protein [Sclerotinia sclerotiorum 1980 UF-70]EDN95673.1 predicted protein [Sclerotinia sclerotiorum 1980 UF-70]